MNQSMRPPTFTAIMPYNATSTALRRHSCSTPQSPELKPCRLECLKRCLVQFTWATLVQDQRKEGNMFAASENTSYSITHRGIEFLEAYWKLEGLLKFLGQRRRLRVAPKKSKPRSFCIPSRIL